MVVTGNSRSRSTNQPRPLLSPTRSPSPGAKTSRDTGNTDCDWSDLRTLVVSLVALVSEVPPPPPLQASVSETAAATTNEMERCSFPPQKYVRMRHLILGPRGTRSRLK